MYIYKYKLKAAFKMFIFCVNRFLLENGRCPNIQSLEIVDLNFVSLKTIYENNSSDNSCLDKNKIYSEKKCSRN